jgi:SRSO17 transposase
MPQEWMDDPVRCREVGLPGDVVFQKKWEIALALPQDAWQEQSWWQGTKGVLHSRFALFRVRPTAGCLNRKTGIIDRIPEQEWLLLEWPEGEAEPTKYWLSTMPEGMPIAELIDLAKLRWRIEEDYEDLKQEVGLGNFEGRTWRGFHHHASICIASYAFLIAERARLFPPTVRTTPGLPRPAVPESRPWRRPAPKRPAS